MQKPQLRWVPFGSENLSQPEVRANVALGHAFSSPILGQWLRSRLRLPECSLVLSARFLGVRERPDLSVFNEDSLLSVIECELGARNPAQGEKFKRRFGVDVLWVVGANPNEGDLTWQEIRHQALEAMVRTGPESRGSLLMLAATIEAALSETKGRRQEAPVPLEARSPAWFGGAFALLIDLVDTKRLVNIPFDPGSISLRILASPPLKPGLSDGLSLLHSQGMTGFVKIIGPKRVRDYFRGGTNWVTLYEQALTSIVIDPIKVATSEFLKLSSLQVIPYAIELRQAYELLAKEIWPDDLGS
ncbi:hypothetical protein [Belnapia moabensis]|uniref:hypothetical protein n=1 Tax=Belnapia moabensis TaxID=365533 RepID=UPI0012ED0D8C|nr:hypothetical protein [Belnapia moabensis]